MHPLHEFLELARSAETCNVASSACLKDLRDVYFICLLGCTALVAIGLAMEVGEIWHDAKEAFCEKSLELKHWLSLPIDRKEYPARVSRSKKLWATAGWVLIVVGVVGEGVFEGFVYKYDLALSALSDSLIADTQIQAAQLAIDLEKEKQETARAQLALKAAFDAEREKHEPRHVTKAQADCMMAALNGMHGQSLNLWMWEHIPEAQTYAGEIGRVFTQALGDGNVHGTDSARDWAPRTGIDQTGGSKPFSDAVYSALSCLVPSGAPKINRGPDDPKNPVEVFIFPDTSRRSR